MSMATPPDPTPLLEVRGLRVSFGGTPAVRGVDLQLAAGETLALVGESGCGKSTTALALMRLLPRHARLEGTVRFDGQSLLELDERALRRVRGGAMAMIFQEPMSSLNPVVPVGEQVAEAVRLHEPVSRAAAARRAVELLSLVQLPEPQRRARDVPHQLSGGQRQRVMIAMAVACQPKLLIADEPTTAIDVTIQAQILALIRRLQRELSMAVLLITHDLALVDQQADRVLVMHDGRVLESGPVARVLRQPQHAYTQGLLGASLHLYNGDDRALHERHDVHDLHDLPTLHYRQRRLPEIVTTRSADGEVHYRLHQPPPLAWPAPSPPALPPAAPLLSVQDLQVRYETASGPVDAVRGVSFEVHAGETVGLVGESGCGKSTLSRAILRLEAPTAGRILLGDIDLTHLDRAALRPHRPRLQMVFQDPYGSLNPRQTVGEILDTALRLQPAASLGERLDRGARQRRVAAIVDRVGLPAAAVGRYPHEFSGGQRQRIGIARALVLRPALVICDEPVSALDVSVQAQILNLLAELKAEFGLAYLFISHDLAVVRYIADRVLVMHGGRIVEHGDAATLWRAPQHPYTRRLLAAAPRRAQEPTAGAGAFASADALATPA